MARALMRYAVISTLGASAMALAVIRPPIPQARAQFLDVVVFAPASVRRPLDEANAIFLYEKRQWRQNDLWE